ncbi:MAG: hypothetical protein R6V58_15700 [Planctomycetota bacterium]
MAVRRYCDATVAIEGPDGKIVRHLAAGVLGPNAPEPFQKNSLEQTVVWDGKDDQGRYVDDKDACSVRVSLGLKPRFERTLYWSPQRQVSLYPQPIIVRARAEGVYVFDPGLVSPGHAPQLKLFDHQGDYIRTIYPLPAGKLGEIDGLRREAFEPDGRRFPLKWGIGQTNLLTAGNVTFGSEAWPRPTGEDERRDLVVGRGPDAPIYLVSARLNRLTKDGSAPAAGLNGPVIETKWRENRRPSPHPKSKHKLSEFWTPRDAALSPDGKWLYLTRYSRHAKWNSDAYLPVVTRMRPDGDKPPEVFAGSMESGEFGEDNARFCVPTAVDCDANGRVYVADYMNDRVQVFSPGATYLKTIPVDHPARIQINRRTGELFVFSWKVTNLQLLKSEEWRKHVPATLTRFGPFEDPKELDAWPMTPRGWMANTRAEIDFHVEPWTVWLTYGHSGRRGTGTGRDAWRQYAYRNMQVRILERRGRQLVQVRDFNADAKSAIAQIRPPRHGRQRLYVNPAEPALYVGEQYYPHPEHIKSFRELVRIDPATGNCKIVRLPFDSEDLAFDAEGYAYLRTETMVARYDARSWREVPFDYGEKWDGVGYHFGRGRVASAVVAAGRKGPASSQLGGMGASPTGNVAVSFFLPQKLPDRKDDSDVHGSGTRTYLPRVFPGRSINWLVHVWDRHGKLLYEDALPGVPRLNDVEIDRTGNIYALVKGYAPAAGRWKINPYGMTLIKARPRAARVLQNKGTPVPLPAARRPDRPYDLVGSIPGSWNGVKAWVVGAEWLRSGVGIDSKHTACHCEANSQFALDYFGRSFVPEVHRYDIVVFDTNGNPILRLGRCGNVDDGMPLVEAGGPPEPRSIGGDEVALISPKFVAVHTDRRLFIADIGNQCVVCVKLGYRATETVALADADENE